MVTDRGGTSEEKRSRPGASRRGVLRSVAGLGAGVLVGSAGAEPLSGWRANNGRRTDGVEGSGSSRRGLQVGIHTGSGIDAVGRTNRIESWIGPRFDVQNVFVPFDDGRYELDELFGRVLPAVRGNDRTPMLTWEPYLTSGSTPENVVERVLAGEYDGYLDEWAARMGKVVAEATVDRSGGRDEPVAYVRLAHEANGNWYPWAPAGGTSSPADYREMWRHVRSRVERGLGGKGGRLAWVWAVNGVDIGPYTMEELYPGDAYVDWLGVDNYNWGVSQPWSDWQSPVELFEAPVERVRAVAGRDLPVGVTEFASSSATETGYDVERKARWIGQAFEALDRADVDMAVWFNRDRKTDWAVFGGARGTDRIRGRAGRYDVYPAYRDGILRDVR